MTTLKQCRRESCCMLTSCRRVPTALLDCTIVTMYYGGEMRSHSRIYGPEAPGNHCPLVRMEHLIFILKDGTLNLHSKMTYRYYVN